MSLCCLESGIFLLFNSRSCLSLLHEGEFYFGFVLFVFLSLYGYQAYPWSLWGLFVVGQGNFFSFCEESTTFSTLTNMEEFSHAIGYSFYA